MLFNHWLTSKARLHRMWNSQVKPTLLVLLELEYSFSRAVSMEHATSCWETQQYDSINTMTFLFPVLNL